MNLSSHVRNDVPMLRAFYDHMLLRDVRRLEQWTFFFAGSTTYLWRERVPLDRKLFLAAFVMTALLVQAACSWTFLPHGAVRALSVLPITASYCLLWLSVRLPFENFGRHGDFSYGFYLYAFPVQQLLSLFRLNQLGFAAYLVLVVAGTFPLAVASWFLVERPCLRMKNTTFAALRGSPPSSGRAP